MFILLLKLELAFADLEFGYVTTKFSGITSNFLEKFPEKHTCCRDVNSLLYPPPQKKKNLFLVSVNRYEWNKRLHLLWDSVLANFKNPKIILALSIINGVFFTIFIPKVIFRIPQVVVTLIIIFFKNNFNDFFFD